MAVESINLITSIGKEVAKKEGNKNGRIDTTSEDSIFVQRLEAKNIANAKQYVEDYRKNQGYFENVFSIEHQTVDSDEYAIYAALNKYSVLNQNDDTEGFYQNYNSNNWTIAADQISSDNILSIIEEESGKNYESFQKLAKKLNKKGNADKLSAIIETLINVAESRGINTELYIKKSKNTEDSFSYVVVNVPGLSPEDKATDTDNFVAVIDCLYNVIKETEKIATEQVDEETSSEDTIAKIYHFATVADHHATEGNKDGVVNNGEVSIFKSLCEKVGIYINKILSDASDKSGLNSVEQAVQNVFSDTAKDTVSTAVVLNTTLESNVNGMTREIDDHNYTEALAYTKGINKDNVVEILKAFKEVHGKNLNEYITDEFSGGKRREALNKPIFDALWEKAEEAGVLDQVKKIISKSDADNDYYIANSAYGSVGRSAMRKGNSALIDKIIDIIENA